VIGRSGPRSVAPVESPVGGWSRNNPIDEAPIASLRQLILRHWRYWSILSIASSMRLKGQLLEVEAMVLNRDIGFVTEGT
jgi:hypothetical protein